MERTVSRLSILVLTAIALTGCSGGSERRDSAAAPTSPSPARAGAPSAMVPAGTAPTASTPSGVERGHVLLPAERAAGPLDVAFPGRDESFQFRQALEAKYRDGLRRQATTSYVDIEGDLVWTQEYLRYRVNQCGHGESIQHVMTQIDGGPPPAVCGSSPSSSVPFPPRNESFDFRQELERKYRDGLRRQPSPTYVDVEGSIVWTQEYLRYRVNACGHAGSTLKVMEQIDGRGIAAVCNADMSGVWDGQITNYFNSPFVMDLVQSGSLVYGPYSDRHDSGAFSGTLTGDRLQGRVDFGDTGILVDAWWDGGDIVNGDMTIGGGVGRRSFEMRRRR